MPKAATLELPALRDKALAFLAASGMDPAAMSVAVLGYTRLVPFMRGLPRDLTEADREALAAYLDAHPVEGGAP